MKALRYSYIGRKQKKRIFRKIWISRINAASRINGISYSQLTNRFKNSNIDLNRKMLSQIAILDASTFKSLISVVK
jgi:large subunit ribosomal protein L20